MVRRTAGSAGTGDLPAMRAGSNGGGRPGIRHRAQPRAGARRAWSRPVRYGLPIVEVPRQTPFIAISRAVSAAVAADEYAAGGKDFHRPAGADQGRAGAGGPGRLVRLLAQQVTRLGGAAGPVGRADRGPSGGRPAKVDELAAEMAVLAAHRGTVSSGFPLGADTVSLQSVGAGPRGRAFLAVGRPGQLTATDRHLVERRRHAADDQAGAVVGHEAGLGQLRSAVLRLVLAGQADLAMPIAEQLSTALPAEPVTVLVAIGDVAEIWPRAR